MALPKCLVPLSKTMDDLKKDQKSMSKNLLANPSEIKSILDQKLAEAGGIEGIMAKAKAEGKKNLITKVDRTQKVGSVLLLPNEYYDIVKVECSSIGSKFFWEELNYKIETYDDGDTYVDVGKDRRVIKVTYRVEDKNPPKNYQEELFNLKNASSVPELFNKLADEIEKTFKYVDDKVADIVEKIRKDGGDVPKNPNTTFSNEEFQAQFQKDLAAFQAQGGALGPLQRSMQTGSLSKLGIAGQSIGSAAVELIGTNGLGNSNSTVTQLSGTSLTSSLTPSGVAQEVGDLDFNSLLQKALSEQPTTRTITKTTPVVKNYDSVEITEENVTIVKVEIVQKGGNWFSSTNDYIWDPVNSIVIVTKADVPVKLKVTYSFEEPIPEAAKAADTLPDAPLDICKHVSPIEVKQVIEKSKDALGKEIEELSVFKQTKSKQVITTVSAPPKMESVQEVTTINKGEETKVSESNPSAITPVVVVEQVNTEEPPIVKVSATNTITKSRKVLEEEWTKAKKEIGDVFVKYLDEVVINVNVLQTFSDINPKILANNSAFNSLWNSKVLDDDRWKEFSTICQNLDVSMIDPKAINEKALPSLSNELREFYNDASELNIEKFRIDELKDLLLKLSWTYCTGIADKGIFGSPETHSVPVYNLIPNYSRDIKDVIELVGIMNANYDQKDFKLTAGERFAWQRYDGQINFMALNSTEGDNAWFDEYTVSTLDGSKIRKFEERNAGLFFKETLPKTLATIKRYHEVVQPLGSGGPGTTGYSWFKKEDFTPQV